MPARTPQVIERQVVAHYARGQSSLVVGRRFGLGHKTVCSILRRHNVTVRAQDTTRHTLSADYFATIDTEGKAYWLWDAIWRRTMSW
jgi:hypothetical protein